MLFVCYILKPNTKLAENNTPNSLFSIFIKDKEVGRAVVGKQIQETTTVTSLYENTIIKR